jgi:Cu-Zn family superoxide dismutase
MQRRRECPAGQPVTEFDGLSVLSGIGKFSLRSIDSIPARSVAASHLDVIMENEGEHRMKTGIALAALALASAGPAAAQQSDTATASFINMTGEESGTATLTGTAEGVLIEVEVSGLPAGQWVGFHIHQTGKCDAATHHDSAGGHFNPTDVEHGYKSANGPHAGDMPNQHVGADGVLHAQVFNSAVTLDGENAIRGKALMIHGGADDYATQPTGNAGNRQACAVIE